MPRCATDAATSPFETGPATSASTAETRWGAPSGAHAMRAGQARLATKPEFCCTRLISSGGTVPRQIATYWLTLIFFAVLFAGCKQKSKEEAEPAVAPSAS